MMRSKQKMFVCMFIAVTAIWLAVLALYDWRLNQYVSHVEKLESAMAMMEHENKYLRGTIRRIVGSPPIDFVVELWEATAYAPLDPDAVEGLCYAGDPNITASGMPIEPGISVAAGPSVPFGTWLWIEGLGWRRVDDRGAAIRDGRIDICMITREEAIRFGRRQATVIIPKWEEEE